MIKTSALSCMEPGVAWWLRHCATFHTVPGMIPSGVTGFSVTYSLRSHHCPGVDSAPRDNEYQEHFLGVKAASAWGWLPYHLHMPNVMKIWEPEPPETLWATPGLLWDCFTFTFTVSCMWYVGYLNSMPLDWSTLYIQQHTAFMWSPASKLRTVLSCGGVVVKALRYKPAGRGFDSRWCHWNFSVT